MEKWKENFCTHLWWALDKLGHLYDTTSIGLQELLSERHNKFPRDKKRTKTKAKVRMLSHITYIEFENDQTRVIIPCTEIFRHYMAPTAQYAKFAISHEFPSWISRVLKSQSISLPSNRKKLTENELLSTKLLSRTLDTIEAAQLPYKNLKLTHINNQSRSLKSNLLITTKIPTSGDTKLRVSGYGIDTFDNHSGGMYTFIVEKIHDSDHF